MLAPGARVAQYRIEGNLGAGGMGEVFAAFDERLERRVALKFLPAERELDLVARGRMLREARAASALKHPGIVTIYEIGESEGRAFIAMELVEGETLAALSGRRGPMPPAEAVALVRQIGDALSVAHEAGILHRDVKTANLMLDPRGHVKVLDFGLSKRLPGSGTPSSPPAPSPSGADLPPTEADDEHTPAVGVDPSGPTALPESSPPSPPPAGSSGARALQSSEPVTVHGARMGTPGSAAIELMRGEEADRRSDVFSLGVVLYELLAGERPFRGGDLRTLIDAVANERYEPASKRNPAVNARLDAVIARSLRAGRWHRYASIADMVDAAEAAIGVVRGGSGAGRRARTPLVIAAGVLVGLGGVTLWATGRGSHAGGAAGPGAAKAAAAAPITYAPGVPAAPPRALTAQGGCAYSPTFADEKTVVYDYTDAAGANHLWSVPVSGGTPKQLTSGAFTEWRAAPGPRPGEVAYLVSDPTTNKGEHSGIALLDLATGKSEMLSNQVAASVGFVGDTLHYIRRDGAELRRVRDGADETATHFVNAITARLMTTTHDQQGIAFTATLEGATRVCLLTAAAEAPTCPKKPGRLSNSRPALSFDDRAIYYAGAGAIRRVRVDDSADESVLDGVAAVGGLATSPDGKQLVYSDCAPRGPLFDVSATPRVRLSQEEVAGEPGAGPDGRVVYVRNDKGGSSLLLREPDGTRRQLDGPYTTRITQPRFSRDGKRVAYFIATVGLMVLQIDAQQSSPPSQVLPSGEDEDPAWLPDGRILFTRRSGEHPGAYLLDPAGGDPAPLETIPRRVLGALANGNVLLLSIDTKQFVVLDLKTRKERPAPFSPEKVGTVTAYAMAPGGRWLAVQAGDNHRRVYRYDLSAPKPEPELVFEAAQGQTLGSVAITDEGHVLAAPQIWAGEIHVVDAAAGTRF